MAKSRNQKLKILHVAKMLLDLTDDDHGLTMGQILDNLAANGIDAEHKSIYSDIDALRSFGMDIVKRGSARNTEYAIGERDFRQEELMMLIAAVESSKFLTESMSENLVSKLKSLASVHSADQLQSCIQASGGVHMSNRHVFYHIVTIVSAIENGHQISFRYLHRTLRGMEERPAAAAYAGVPRVATPICVLYSEGNVYAATYNQEKDDIYIYRIDHMGDVSELELPAATSEKASSFSPEKFAMQSFGMFSGEPCNVVLLVHESCINAIYDRFGDAAKVINASDDWARGRWARAIVEVIASPQFYGWVAGFAGNVRIESPQSIADGYKKQLIRALEWDRDSTEERAE